MTKLNLVFYADCDQVSCDSSLVALSNWCKGSHTKRYLNWTIFSEPVSSLKDIPQYFKFLNRKLANYKLGAITFAAGHGPPAGGIMQVGSDTAVQAREFASLECVPVQLSADPVVYLNACFCAKGSNGLALCNAVGTYFVKAGKIPRVTVVGPVRAMIGTPPPILSTSASNIRTVRCKR